MGEYPDDGTEVQFMGCARSSVERRCTLGMSGKDGCPTISSKNEEKFSDKTNKSGGSVSGDAQMTPSSSVDDADRQDLVNENSISLSTTSVDSYSNSSSKSFGGKSCVTTYVSTLLTALAVVLVI